MTKYSLGTTGNHHILPLGGTLTLMATFGEAGSRPLAINAALTVCLSSHVWSKCIGQERAQGQGQLAADKEEGNGRGTC